MIKTVLAAAAALVTTAAHANEPINLLPDLYDEIELSVIDTDPIPVPVDIEIEPIKIFVPTAWDLYQIRCMADNVYYEARGEPESGMIAVNHVVFNRVDSEWFPSTPCGVVYQRTRRGCQFSWYCERRYPVRDQELYDRIYRLTYDIYEDRQNGELEDITDGAQYYHATYVYPRWARVFERTRKINMHVFYRENEGMR